MGLDHHWFLMEPGNLCFEGCTDFCAEGLEGPADLQRMGDGPKPVGPRRAPFLQQTYTHTSGFFKCSTKQLSESRSK